MRGTFWFFVVVSLILTTVNADYTAAVVEYTPLTGTTPNDTVERNIEEYTHYIETAANNGVQIIVFPEYGLTGLVDDPSSYAIEIPNVNTGIVYQNYWLEKLSTSAREHTIYVVVNLLEKARDENNNTIYYNTNIVFDRGGQIAAKYRKINLYLEPNLTPGNETVTFTTDFQVTFAILTCFDILYYNPSRTVLNNGTVTDVIFPTAWTSVLPFYHSTTIQSGYAQANRLNLLAANLNSPSKGIGGSGIYRYDGTIDTYYISGLDSSKLLISNLQPRGVPRNLDGSLTPFGFDILNNSRNELNRFISARDFQGSSYNLKQLELTTSEIRETLCYGLFCCDFVISATDITATEVYQLLAYNGPTKLGQSEGNIRLCAVVSCESTDSSTCGSRNVTLNTKFSSISINGQFQTEPDHFYQPISLTTSLLPVFNTTYTSEVTNETIAVDFKTTRTAENLIVFGVLGRGGASTFGSSVIFLIAVTLLKYFF